jgi:hypothetical protein
VKFLLSKDHARQLEHVDSSQHFVLDVLEKFYIQSTLSCGYTVHE